MSNVYAEFGVTGATLSDGELSQHDIDMASQPVSVRDGDDEIVIEPTEEVVEELSTDEEAEATEDQPEDGAESDEESQDGDSPEEAGDDSDVSGAIDEQASALSEAVEAQNALIEEAIAKGLPAEMKHTLEAEYEKTGKFSEASYEALAKAGYSKNFVDSYMRGQEALATAFVNSVVAFAGGHESFSRVQSYMATNGMAEAFNAAVERSDAATIKALIGSAKTMMGKTFGKAPARDVAAKAKPVVRPAATPSVQPFESREEMIKAMSDRRYSTDDKYRREVEQRVFVSRI